MSYYTEEDLRDFVQYAKDYFKELKKEDVNPEEHKAVNDLVSIIVTMRYNAMVFESYIQGHSAKDYLLSKDLQKLPLHISDDGLLSQIIVKWRLQRNK
jgi:hypothetical protein